jgi:hypothetical protein
MTHQHRIGWAVIFPAGLGVNLERIFSLGFKAFVIEEHGYLTCLLELFFLSGT